jgi:hypothetical protein
MELPFVPIARRDLKFVSDAIDMDITLALSAPYRPSKTPNLGPVACMILDCDEPALAREICGNDEFEALQMALLHFEKFIDSLNNSGKGILQNLDGTPFTQSAPSLFAHYLSKPAV